MRGVYSRFIHRWENRLATRDKNRLVRGLEWGLEWLEPTAAGSEPRQRLREYCAWALAHSEDFFSYRPPADYQVHQGHLTFTSPLPSPYPENNLVHADFFPAQRNHGRAVVVLPQWNADVRGHVGVCKLLNRFGLTALRMSLAYHDRRKPPELERADYHLSSNVGRTIHACRQSVIDARACVGWLRTQGYRKIALLGTSLGSCIAFIAAAHEASVCAQVLNHVSMYFGDVVWTGLSTRHVRQGFGNQVSQEELRQWWAVISPAAYLDRMRGRDVKTLLIWARYDTTFLPVYSRQVVEGFRARNLPHQALALPCAHYTTGRFPFNLLDGLAMCGFLAWNL
jgi:pimeloyl-ACP methyl ester carboxylesterase